MRTIQEYTDPRSGIQFEFIPTAKGWLCSASKEVMLYDTTWFICGQAECKGKRAAKKAAVFAYTVDYQRTRMMLAYNRA